MKFMNDIQRQQEHFNLVAEEYFRSRSSERAQFICRTLLEYLVENSPLKTMFDQDVLILDAMCGFANNLDLLRQVLPSNFTYEAFDYSDKIVEFAKSNHPEAYIYCQDICKLDQKDKYDIVILIGGLHHVYSNINIALNNIQNALKQSGYFINFEPTHNNIITKAIREYTYKHDDFFDETTEKDFTTDELNSLMADANLRPVFQFYPGLLAYVLWYNPDVFPKLNIGSMPFVKFYVNIEKKIWSTRFSRFFSFATYSLFQKI